MGGLQLPESMTFDDYVSVDQDVQTHEEITESDIIAELQSGPMELEEEEEEEDDVEIVEEQTKVCSFAEAKSFMHELRRYFESSTKTTDSDFSSINKLEFALTKNVCQKQSSITEYLR